jgi:anti-sigma-K factor RskA
MAHKEQQLLGAYVMGALDSEERIELEAHLGTCQECQADLVEYQQVSDGLLHLAIPIAPSSGLRASLTARLAGHPGSLRTPRRRGIIRAPNMGFAALAVTLLVLNGALILETRRLAERGEELLAQQEASQTALALASYSTSQTAFVQEERIWGTFVYEGNFPLAVFNVWGLPPLPEDQAYQLWLFNSDGTRSTGALFRTAESQELISVLIRSSIPLGEVLGFGVTVEPDTGSQAPTGPRIIGADFDHSP